MIRVVILDSGPLGLASNSLNKPDAAKCFAWFELLRTSGFTIAIPEIARYEVRRELVRIGATAGLRRLDELQQVCDFLPLTTPAIEWAANLWADVRRAGKPTAPDLALDGDAILAAQALVAAETGLEVIIATTNVAHLARFRDVDARLWWTVS